MSRKLQARGHGALFEPPSAYLRLFAAGIDTLLVVGFLALFLILTETSPLPDPEAAGWLLLLWSATWLLQVHLIGATLGQRLLGLGRIPEGEDGKPTLLEKLTLPVLRVEKLSLARQAQVAFLSVTLAWLVSAGIERSVFNHPLWLSAKTVAEIPVEAPKTLRLLGEDPMRTQPRLITWPNQGAQLVLGDSAAVTPQREDSEKAKRCLTGSVFKRFSLPCLGLRSLLFAPTVLSWEKELGKNLRWELSWIDSSSGCALLTARGKGRVHSACLSLVDEKVLLRAFVRHPERPEIMERQASKLLFGAIQGASYR